MEGSGFHNPLITTRYAPGGVFQKKKHALCVAHSFDIGHVGSGDRITAPAGFVTDFASWWWPRGKYENAALMHDWLYWDSAGEANHRFTRQACDDLFFQAMLAAGVNQNVAYLMYKGVRVGGIKAYSITIPRDKDRGVTRMWMAGADYIASRYIHVDGLPLV